MSNRNLHAAKKAKNDEFYTRLEDIEEELRHYARELVGRKVYCNCDDWRTSNFVKYFSDNFGELGIKELVSICIAGKGMRQTADGIEHFDLEDGSFASDECLALMDEADIVVTNPPFSLFREFVATLEEQHKRYLIIGNVNAITYKEFFPLIKENKVWLGCHRPREFVMPDSYELTGKAFVDEQGRKRCRMGTCCWYTNLEHGKRHEPMILDTARHNLKFNKGLVRKLGLEDVPDDDREYPHYDNFDGIEVPVTDAIPCDWDGAMGVPITFLGSYNPDQFEIVGLGNGAELFGPTKTYINARMIKNGKESNGNAINRVLVYPAKETEKVLYKADNVDGYLFAPYARILIRNRRPTASSPSPMDVGVRRSSLGE